jgi:hypothetical protein
LYDKERFGSVESHNRICLDRSVNRPAYSPPENIDLFRRVSAMAWRILVAITVLSRGGYNVLLIWAGNQIAWQASMLLFVIAYSLAVGANCVFQGPLAYADRAMKKSFVPLCRLQRTGTRRESGLFGGGQQDRRRHPGFPAGGHSRAPRAMRRPVWFPGRHPEWRCWIPFEGMDCVMDFWQIWRGPGRVDRRARYHWGSPPGGD